MRSRRPPNVRLVLAPGVASFVLISTRRLGCGFNVVVCDDKRVQGIIGAGRIGYACAGLAAAGVGQEFRTVAVPSKVGVSGPRG